MNARSRKLADRAWKTMVSAVMDTRGDWKRKVVEATGLPFSRLRALRRLDAGPRTLRDLAEAMVTDAPAASLAVSDLEERGLVERRPHPDDRRAKLIVLTPAGRRVLAQERSVIEEAPAALMALPERELEALVHIIEVLRAQGPT